MDFVASRKKFSARSLLLLFLVVLIVGFSYYLCVDRGYQWDSEATVSGMLTAGYLDLDLSESRFGQNTFQVGGIVYDQYSPSAPDIADGYITTFLFYPEIFNKEDISIANTREQQLGVQGWALYGIGRVAGLLHIPPKICYLLCKLAAVYLLVIVITAISFQLKRAYNPLFALVFWLVSLTSVELHNFSSNLYWLPFLWFLPMLLGLLCLNFPRRRFFIYPLIVMAIALKSGCGYEYIPNIMLASEIFLLTEFLVSFRKDRQRAMLLLRTMFGVGISCLIGFFLVLVLNGYFRGDGSIAEGLRQIYEQDVLRRTFGDAANFEPKFAKSLNASLMSVLFKYTFTASSGLLSLFLLLTDGILILKKRSTPEASQDLILLVLGYIFCYSWFVLAKSHAYVHKFSDVMFFLPFLQIAVYILAKRTLEIPAKYLSRDAGRSLSHDHI